jgi:uncharacterized protein YjbI with pentapeptide repeats
MVEIRRWDNDRIIHSGRFNSIKECLEDGIRKGISFAFANLPNANLPNANLSKVNLSDAILLKADLSFADLSFANLSTVNLENANLTYANLSFTNFSDAILSPVNLSHTNLAYTKMKNTRFLGDRINYPPIQITNLKWWVQITEYKMKISCECYTHLEWKNFKKSDIDEMHKDGGEFWQKHKKLLLEACSLQASRLKEDKK